MTRLNDVFNMREGIFYHMARMPNTELPWKESALSLDLQYHGNHSGGKITSPLVDTYISDGQMTDVGRDELAQICLALFLPNWRSLYHAMTSEYNPINNYDMKETYSESGNSTDDSKREAAITHGEQVATSGKNTDTGTLSNNETTTHGETVATTGETVNNIFGFNSGDAVPSDKGTGTNNEIHGGSDQTTTTETRDLSHDSSQTESHSGSDLQSGTENHTGKHDIEHTLTRSGNIGVTTSQQMIESEIELRKKHFFESVFSDLDSVLTINVY